MIKVAWTAAAGSQAYRCVLIDPTGKEVGRSDPAVKPSCVLDIDLAHVSHIRVQLSHQLNGNQWVDYGPPARLPPRPTDSTDVIKWSGDSDLYRLTIHDFTEFGTVFDEPVLGNQFPLSATGADLGHELRFSISAWQASGWTSLFRAKPLPVTTIMGKHPLIPPPPLSTSWSADLLLLFTVDTEAGMHRMRNPSTTHAVNELIFGDYGNQENLGIGLHMDLLEHFGHRGCFFVDILMEFQFGRVALEKTIDAILERGHEVQLHVHTHHLFWHNDPSVRSLYRALEHYDSKAMRNILELSIELFEQRVGTRPLAYRAGGYHVDDQSIRLLQDFDIPFDSSIVSYFRARTADWTRSRTQPFPIGDVLEVPPSWFLRSDHGSPTDTRVYAPNPTAGDPITHLFGATPPHVATFVSHSFQLMRYVQVAEPDFRQRWIAHLEASFASADECQPLIPAEHYQWSVHEPAADDGMVATVAHLLRRVAERPKARCVTFAELAAIADNWRAPQQRTSVDPVAVLDFRSGTYQQKPLQIYSRSFLHHLDQDAKLSVLDVEAAELQALSQANLDWRDLTVAVKGGIGVKPQEWLQARVTDSLLTADGISLGQHAHTVDVVLWLRDFHCQRPDQLATALSDIHLLLRHGGSLVALAWPFGVRENLTPLKRFPVADLLFSETELAAFGVESPESVTPLDRSSWARWLRAIGFSPHMRTAALRPKDHLALLAQHGAKLKFLPPDQLTEAVMSIHATTTPQASQAYAEPPEHTVPAIHEPEAVLSAARERFDATKPGADIRIAFSSSTATLSPVSTVLAWQRAGFERTDMVATQLDDSGAQLVRPLTVADIDGYGGRHREA